MNQDPNKRPNGTYKPKAERVPPIHFNCRSSLQPVNLDAAIGIPTGDGSRATSWEELERVLGKETVDRMRAGT